MLGLLVDTLDGAYQSTVLRGVADAAAEHDESLCCFAVGVIESASPVSRRRNALLELVESAHLRGLLVVTGAIANALGPEVVLDRLARLGIPMCSIAVAYPHLPSVVVDDERGMLDALHHLLDECGRRRIAFVRGPPANIEAERRYAVYQRVLRARGLAERGLVAQGDFSRESGEAAVATLFDTHDVAPDAIVAADDTMALGVLDALLARGLAVPRDVAVVGFDDLDEARHATVPLTTVRQPLYEQGRRAVEALLDAVDHEVSRRAIVLPTELVRRASTGFVGAAEPTPASADTTPSLAAFARAFAEISEGIAQRIDDHVPGATVPADRERSWGHRLVDALVGELTGTSPPARFVPEVREGVAATLARTAGVSARWQEVITILRRHVLPRLPAALFTRSRAEQLWHDARIVIAEAVERGHVRQRLQIERWAATLAETSAAFASAFDEASILSAVEAYFPQLGIRSAFVFLFVRDAPGQAELVLAHDADRPAVAAGLRRRFRVATFAPADVLPDDRRTFVAVPIADAQRCRGWVLFEYGPQQGIIYETLCEQLGGALRGTELVQEVVAKDRERERLLAELELHARKLELAYDAVRDGQRQLLFSRTMAPRGLDLPRGSAQRDPLQRTLTQIVGVLAIDHALVIIDATHADQWPTAARLPTTDPEPGVIVGPTQGRFVVGAPESILGAEHRRALLDAIADPSSVASASASTSGGDAVVLAIRSGGAGFGAVLLERAGLQAHEIDLAQTLLEQAAVAIDNVRLYDLAAHDPLTGVHTRVFVERWLPGAIEAACSGRRPLSALMVDMDGLKTINDTLGHGAGDEALAALGRVLREATREHDVVARWGGDEFAVILPDTDEVGADAVGQRVIALARASVLASTGAPLRCSVGSSTLDHAESTPRLAREVIAGLASELLRNADAAQYAAKRDGGARLGANVPTRAPPPSGASS